MKYSANAKIITLASYNFGKVITHTIEGAEIEGLKIDELSLKESKCEECMREFDTGDDIVVIHLSKMNKDGSIPIEAPYLVHIKNDEGKVCIEEFITRMLQSSYTRTEPEESKPTGTNDTPLPPEETITPKDLPNQ